MRNILTGMLSAILSLTLMACGKKDNKDNPPEVSGFPEAESTLAIKSLKPTQHCRPVTEIEGDNFQFFWAVPTPGQIKRLSFDSSRRGVKVEYQDEEEVFVTRYQEEVAQEPQLELGRLSFPPYILRFTNTPSGTIRGARKEYAIAHLSIENQELGYFFCPSSISP